MEPKPLPRSIKDRWILSALSEADTAGASGKDYNFSHHHRLYDFITWRAVNCIWSSSHRLPKASNTTGTKRLEALAATLLTFCQRVVRSWFYG